MPRQTGSNHYDSSPNHRYPGTAASDPEFGPPKRIAGQYYFEVVFLALIALAAWIALRQGTH
jgi:hypothetical protein